MDKIAQYQTIIVKLLEELAARSYSNAPGIERQVVTDLVHHHYQLLHLGWHRGRFAYTPLLHFDIRDGKIWVQQNGTELEIADVLIARGVRPQDVVLGFVPEPERAALKFAAA